MNDKTTTHTQSLPQTISLYVGVAWRWLTEPASTVWEPHARRQARLLARITIILIPTSIWILSVSVRQNLAVADMRTIFREKPALVAMFINILVLVAVYGLSRSKYYTWGAVILTSTIYVTTLSIAASLSVPGSIISFLDYLALVVLLGSLFLSLRGTIVLYIVVMTGIYVIQYLPVPAAAEPMSIIFGFQHVLLVGILIIMASVIRQENVNQIQQQARDLVETERENAKRAQAEAMLRERAARLELVTRVGQRTTAILNPGELLQQTVDLISEAFDYHNVAIRLVDGDEVALKTELEAVKTRSKVAVPIKLKETVIGILDAQSTDPGAVSQLDVFTLQIIADQLAIAIDNTRLYDAMQQEIAERKRAEEELGKHREHLEDMVETRTTELNDRVNQVEQLNRAFANLMEDMQTANLNLEEMTQRLEYTNEELESFVYSVSHDLRAPLRHIDGFVQLLLKREGQKEGLDSTSLRYLNIIAESSTKMGQLIDDLLTFSRTGRVEMKTRRVELDQLVRETRQQLAIDLQERSITWEINPLPAVEGDPALLRQVWANLLSNAIKFTAPRPQAHIEIGVEKPKPSAQAAETDTSQVVVFVRDNGVGFDPQYAHKLFDVFQRLHRENEFPGTGIGLAIVRRVIQRHGGQVWAESELDGGATFYFSLRKASKRGA